MLGADVKGTVVPQLEQLGADEEGMVEPGAGRRYSCFDHVSVER